uniref:Uncharacterized protein n=1 Tax=Bionectria ochroleuca TaxID=29856 RepID=A0A0B7KJW8_BIOOC
MSQRFGGKVAVVTGGGAGYGRGIVEKLKSEGAEVIIADINESASQTASELGCTFVRANVAEQAGWRSILNAAITKHGRIDVIVSNAGACYLKKPTDTVSESEYDLMMNVNVKSLFHAATTIVPHLLEKKQPAVFVSIASISGIRPRPELTWYSASKAAANTASNSLAIEYASKGIRFNTVCPALGITSMTTILTDDQLKGMASVIPIGRMCTPRDVANAVAYLASDDADFITGVNFQVDGGRCV